jgi:Tfp pilus assembly protein PilV
MRHKLALATPIVAVMLLAVAVPALAAVNWQITLKHTAAFPRATGQAQYQSQPGQRDLQVEAEHLRALAGKHVVFYAKGSRLGSAVVTTRGIAQIDRNTELGQAVPKVLHGAHISVRTPGGAVILRGTF